MKLSRLKQTDKYLNPPKHRTEPVTTDSTKLSSYVEEKEIELYKTHQDYLENKAPIAMANIISDIEAIFNENNDKINALIRNQKKILERLDK